MFIEYTGKLCFVLFLPRYQQHKCDMNVTHYLRTVHRNVNLISRFFGSPFGGDSVEPERVPNRTFFKEVSTMNL